jgi:diacylglycerol kinase (ATP)
MVRTQHNAWIHAAATIAVIMAGLGFRISNTDWRWLVAAIAGVWAAEAVNTALEQLSDLVSPGYDVAIEHAKDLAAGAVLVMATGAAIIGVLVFWPYIFG